MPEVRARVGTSGWSYDHWQGTVYPEHLARDEWLTFYGDRFDTVEVNNTFYQIPTPSRIDSWQERTPTGFRFGFKLSRSITYDRELLETRDLLGRFFGAVGRLPEAERGPILVQPDPELERDVDRLAGFLADVEDVTGSEEWRVAVEFRNEDWLHEDTFAVLDGRDVALCLHDMPGKGPVDEPNEGAPFVYLRRHGADGEYTKRYSEEQIARDAERALDWRAQGRTVFAYYNNDLEGHAPRDASRFVEAMAERS